MGSSVWSHSHWSAHSSAAAGSDQSISSTRYQASSSAAARTLSSAHILSLPTTAASPPHLPPPTSTDRQTDSSSSSSALIQPSQRHRPPLTTVLSADPPLALLSHLFLPASFLLPCVLCSTVCRCPTAVPTDFLSHTLHSTRVVRSLPCSRAVVMKAAMRALKNAALSYSDVEVKVREATSNDPWSCPLSLMKELSRATHDYVDYPKLFAMLWRRLADVEHVMHVTKALQLLDFLVRHGSERFVLDVKRRQRDIAALQRYKHYDHNNQDDAKEARAKAKQIHELLASEARLQAERQQAEKQRQQSDRDGGAYQLTEDEQAEQELYRARKRQLKTQRMRQQPHHDSKDADDEEDEEVDVHERTADDDEDGHRRRQPQQTQSKRTNRGRQTEEEEMDEQDEQSEEKRQTAAGARKSKSVHATIGARPNATARSGSGADRGGAESFDPVSEEELDDEDAADSGVKDSQSQQRSTRVTKRTVRRKTTSSSVQEAEGDEVTQELEEQEERTQAQRNNVSAQPAIETHSHNAHTLFAAPRARPSSPAECVSVLILLVPPRTEPVESAASRSAALTLCCCVLIVAVSLMFVACIVGIQSVVRKQSSLQPNGSTASSVHSVVAESPIPLLDDLLSQPAQPQQSSSGGGRQRGQRGPTAASSLPLTSRSSRPGVSYGAGDVGDEVEIPSVADELDLLSLANQPNVYLIPSTQHGRAAADIDILTGTPLVDEQSMQPALPPSGRPQRGKASSTSASTSSYPASPAVSNTLRRTPATSHSSSGTAAPTSSSPAAGRRSAQPHTPQPTAAAAASKANVAVSAKKAALLAQLAALEQEDSDLTAYQQQDNEQQYVDSQHNQPVRGGSGAQQSVRSVAAAPIRRAKQQTAQPPQRYYDDEQQYDEEAETGSVHEQYQEPALLDTLPAAPAPPVAAGNTKPVSQRATAATVARKAATPQPVMSDVWNDNTLTDLDHLASSSSGLPSVPFRAPAGSSMAEMQRAAPFPSASSVASSLLDDEALQSAFARKAPTTTNLLSAAGGRNTSAARRKPAAASTDIFFQS